MSPRFNDLPDEAYVRVDTVATLYSVAPVSIWRWAKAGRIPKPRKLGPQVTAWNVGELRRSLACGEAA
jgi:predicted DNA-binding transcriptional regulator AlpA